MKEETLSKPVMKPSISVNTSQFRKDYDTLLKEVLEESSDEEEDLLDAIDIDMDTATADLPEDLRTALEDRSLADKYLANLKTFMSHRRSQSVNSLAAKGDFSLPNTPIQKSFQLLSPKVAERVDPLSKVLDAIPYQTRLINGVPSLTLLEQRFRTLIIPELELPTWPEPDILNNLNKLNKLRDDLSIHFSGGLLTSNIIGEKKKNGVFLLLDEISKEIGLYEEFVKKDKYLNLENILNEPDNSDAENEMMYTESTLHYNTTHTPSQMGFQNSAVQNRCAASDFTMNESHLQSWKPFKWVPLVKISDQLYSSDIKKTSGLISVMALSNYLAIGTTRSLIFVYDFSQNLQCILGDSNRAIEIGAVTALAFSADSNTVVCGYSQGYIIVWDIRKPDQPMRIIEPISIDQTKKKGGHLQGASILHVGFVGTRRSEIVSADDRGMSFYHVSYKMMMIGNTHSVRLLGSYHLKRPSTIFAMQLLPSSRSNHPAEHFSLVALLNPYKIVIVALKPKPQILFKFNKPKVLSQQDSTKAIVESLSGCLAWLPMTGSDSPEKEDPMLAFSWGKHLFLLSVQALPNDKSRRIQLKFSEVGEWESPESIVSIQWMSRQIIVLSTPNENMVLFDPKNMVETHYTNVQDKQVVYHDWFNVPLKNLVWDANTMTDTSTEKVLKSVEMAYYGSIKSHKGKLFLLCLDQIYVGTLLSWKDRILALLRAGSIVESISLATSFYKGIDIQTVVGLPENEEERKELVKKNLIELLEASLKYTFAPKHVTHDPANEVTEGNTVTIRGLAHVCIDACLSIDCQEFLFEIYERFLANQVAGLFLEALEPAILEDYLSDIPPSVMKELVDHYSKKRLLDELEQIIWHIKPSSLDIDQVVSMCHREGMYEAMMYVWNTSMQDYVSPLVEMLKIIRSVLRDNSEDQHTLHARSNAEKIFDYLKAILQGKSFPEGSGATISAYEAGEARSAVYSFVFSGRCVTWPPVGGKLVMTIDDDEGMLEPTYPYLRLLLRFNTRKFLECLEIAFEDPWLNGGEDILSSKFEDEVPGKVISRQIVVNTLLDVFGGGLLGDTLPPPRLKPSLSASTVHSFATNHRTLPPQVSKLQANAMAIHEYSYFSNENIILLYIFIASNLHKYTTFILLPQKILNKVLTRLSEDHDLDTHKEREEAVQKLLSVFSPLAHENFVKLFEDAGFWKVLEKVYYKDKKFGKLVTAYLKDEEKRDVIFDCVKELMEGDLTEKHKTDVLRAFMICISQFVEIDGQKTADFVERFGHGNHEDAIRRLEEDQEFDDDENHATADKHLFSYLRGLLESNTDYKLSDADNHKLQERYIELMCRFDPSGVFNYCHTRIQDKTSLDTIISVCEKYGIMDAAV
ncbi:Golgi CORVET complex core vacuolar protein 8-domain-containing protein, partial [Sporodiniella umbellata]